LRHLGLIEGPHGLADLFEAEILFHLLSLGFEPFAEDGDLGVEGGAAAIDG
jgi:hypothetical protein